MAPWLQGAFFYNDYMELKSVGLNSDLEILKITSKVIDRGDYLKVETLNNPYSF